MMDVYDATGLAQFENINSLRKYPFADDAELAGSPGAELPRDLVVDAHFVVPSESNGAAPKVYLTSAYISEHLISVCFRLGDGADGAALSTIVSMSKFSPFRTYRLQPVAGAEDVSGVVTFGNMDVISVAGRYTLRAEIHPCCVVAFSPAGLRYIEDERTGDRISGDVPIVFSDHVLVEQNGGNFHLKLDDGSAEELASECEKASGTDVCGATPITSINGVAPDEDGNIVLWFH